MVEHGELSSPNTGNSTESDADSSSKTHASGTETPQLLAEEIPPVKRKMFNFKAAREKDLDSMPLQYRHVRLSQWKVKDEFYQTCANLCTVV